MTQPPSSVVVEQVRAARHLFDHALRSGALASGAEALGARLRAFEAQPVSQPLAAWARDFSVALGAEGAPEVVSLARALEIELEGKTAAAVFELGETLLAQRRLLKAEVLDAAVLIDANPTTEELRSVLQTWIHRLAAGGGPILGWVRDLHDRLALPGASGGEPR
jgi:hypothetical protein